MLGVLFHEVLYRPLFNALIALYDFLPGRDLGLAIIVLTLLVRLLLAPILHRQLRSQRALATLQPRLAEIRKSTKDAREQSRRLMELYKKHGVNPTSGCLPLLVQLPILWAMFAVLRNGLQPDALTALYPFVPHPGAINPVAFGIMNLALPALRRAEGALAISWPAVILALLTGVVTYWQIRTTPTSSPHPVSADQTSTEQIAHRMSKQMLLFMPLTTTYFTLVFPTGLALYWFVTTLVSVLQQRYFIPRRSASA